MENKALKIKDPGRSVFVIMAAVCFTAAALLAVPGVVSLFDPEAVAATMKRIVKSGVVDRSARQFWLVVYFGLDVLNLVIPAIMAVSLWLTIIPKEGGRQSSAGTTVLIFVTKVMRWSVFILAAALIAVFVYRAVDYIMGVKDHRQNVLYISGMIASEGLLGAALSIAFVFVAIFLKRTDITLVSVEYTIITGKPDPRSISIFVSVMLVVFAGIAIMLGLDGRGNIIMYIFAALGNIFAAAFLYRHKIEMERKMFALERTAQ